MFEKIVLATDLSADWDQIIACAAEFKALGCTHAILTHVIVTKGLVGADTVAQTESQPRLEAQRKQLEAHGLRRDRGNPAGAPCLFPQ